MPQKTSWRRRAKDYAVDIQRDRDGQFFELRLPTHLRDALDVSVMQNEPKQRHLLLLVRNTAGQEKLDRFLCGHDEREWFVAAVPGGASSVRQAMDRLQPADVQSRLASERVPFKQRYTRKNRCVSSPGRMVLRAGSSVCGERKTCSPQRAVASRSGQAAPRGGTLPRRRRDGLCLLPSIPNGVTERQYRRLLQSNPKAAGWRWRVMRRNMRVFARGTVRHSDHATITLPFWHSVHLNTETQSGTMARVAFLD